MEAFGDGSNPGYVKIAVYRPNENGGREPIVPEIRINASDTVIRWDFTNFEEL